MKYEPLLKHLLIYDDIVIQAHHNPDADAITSGFALCRYLEKKREEAALCLCRRTRNQQAQYAYHAE